MKASEISVGDLVKVLNYYWDGRAYTGQVDGVVKKHGVYYLRFGDALSAEIDMCQPVPLTSEILEKNGFQKVPQPECVNPYHWKLKRCKEGGDGLLYSIKAYNTPFHGMYVNIDQFDVYKRITLCKQIEYVHELQRALRLCEITLNIEV